MSQLALYLFGPPRLELNGAPVHISRRKVMALLAYLAVSDQSHSRDSLAALLWPENDGSSARAGLRRMLSVLKQALGEGVLIADRETVRLNTLNDPPTSKSFLLDVTAFQGVLKVPEAHNHPPILTCSDCLHSLEEAVVLYSDDFMSGFSLKDCPAYDEWQFFQAEELRSQLTNALVRLSSHYAGTDDHEAAIRHARRWLALDPLHEPAHRHLMTLYEGSGQRAAALRQYETCRQVLADELGVQPSEKTRDLFERIRTTTLISLPDAPPKSNLPAQPTPFIGRETELAEIRAKLKEVDCRLLTLLGPGGSGKTRLAIEAATAILADYKHGVFFVNLAPLQEADKIPSTIAGALNFSFSEAGTPGEQLLDYLRNKEMLLVLDNFEHIITGAKLVNKIIQVAPGVKILATSRTRMMITGEHLYEVMGMAYPELPISAQTASHKYSALKLFESEAMRVQRDFKLTDENITDVIRICSLLEGNPLGIVLAASWVRMLTPVDIAEEITRDLAFLDTEMGDLPQRQRSLRSVFNHSWRLLSDGEREIMKSLSVFRGGFTRESAQKISGASLNNLMGLLDKSILHCTPTGRFEIHELLRQYAAEKLGVNPVTKEGVRGIHSDYYCQTLAVWERDLQGPRQYAAKQEMAVEIDNIRAAWVWALDNARLKTLLGALNGLCLFLERNRQRLESLETCWSIVERLDSLGASEGPKADSLDGDSTDQVDRLKLQARALAWGGISNALMGDLDLSLKQYQKCLSTLERRELAEQDTRFEKAFALQSLPLVMSNFNRGDTKPLAEEVVQLYRSLDEPWWMGRALIIFGLRAGSIDERISFYERSLAVLRKLGDLWAIAHALGSLARDNALQGQFDKAEALAYEALDTWKELDDREGIVATYGILGTVLVWQGRFTEARSLEGKILTETIDLRYTRSRVAWFHAVASFPCLYLGEFGAARDQAQYALELLKDVKRTAISSWTAIAIDILGRVALAEGSYTEAEECFQECLPCYQARYLPENIDQALACVGYAVRGLNQTSQAQGHFYQALELAIEEKELLTLFHTLPGIALLFADQGESERAVELYALAATQGIVANSKWFDDIAGDEIAVAAEKLPTEVVEAAKARGRSLDLWDTSVKLLVELERLGWICADLRKNSDGEIGADRY